MKKILIIACLFVVIATAYWIYSRNTKATKHWEKPARITPVVNIATDYTFPDTNRQFAIKFSSKKATGTSSFNKQQAIKIYLLRDESKPVFTRDYNADGFNGPDLSYIFATDSASFTQRGSLAVLHCGPSQCKLPWANFYFWDKTKNAFVIDNTTQKDYFDQLLTLYNGMDKSSMSDKETSLLQKAITAAKSNISGKNATSNDIK